MTSACRPLAADPDRKGAASDPYELRSGAPGAPSDQDPGSTLNH